MIDVFGFGPPVLIAPRLREAILTDTFIDDEMYHIRASALATSAIRLCPKKKKI
jgi:hypothetical protein